MTRYTSNAEWPDGAILGATNNVTTAVHKSMREAHDFCDLMAMRGFGGEGKIFPVRVWTEIAEPIGIESVCQESQKPIGPANTTEGNPVYESVLLLVLVGCSAAVLLLGLMLAVN